MLKPVRWVWIRTLSHQAHITVRPPHPSVGTTNCGMKIKKKKKNPRKFQTAKLECAPWGAGLTRVDEVARGAPREPRLWEKGPRHPGILGFVGRGREPTPTGPPEGGLYFDLRKSFRFTDAERFHHNLLIRFLHPRSHGSAGTAVITQGTVLGSGDTWRPPPYGVVQVSVTRG